MIPISGYLHELVIPETGKITVYVKYLAVKTVFFLTVEASLGTCLVLSAQLTSVN